MTVSVIGEPVTPAAGLDAGRPATGATGTTPAQRPAGGVAKALGKDADAVQKAFEAGKPSPPAP